VPAVICQQSPKPLREVAKNRKLIRCRVVAKSAGSEDPGCATLWTVALKRPNFNKKGFANISLGLNYCSMGSSWPRSCDTVPLSGTFVSLNWCGADSATLVLFSLLKLFFFLSTPIYSYNASNRSYTRNACRFTFRCLAFSWECSFKVNTV
jgi:hypothetical protein